MAGVTLRGIRKSFGSIPVLRDINLLIPDGEFVVLVGPSGCGKSTLLRILAGLEEVDAGEVMIGGDRVNDLPPAKRGIAMVFQSYALYPHMTVRENMGFGLKLAGKDKRSVAEAVDKVAGLLKVEHLLERRPKMLSGGQRQRVAIGRAIVREPSVFLFDEPLSNLDAELRVRMRYEFASLHRRLKTTTVYVTHDQVEAMTLADRIAIMDRGEVKQFGTAEELYERPSSQFVAGFVGSPRMNFLKGTIAVVTREAVELRLRDGSTAQAAVAVDGGEGNEVTLGIRPEHLRLSTEGLPADVTLIESLGSVRFAYVATGAADEPLVIQLAPSDQVREGESIFLALPPGYCHLFAADGSSFRRNAPLTGSIAA